MKVAKFITEKESGIQTIIDIDNTTNFKDFIIKIGEKKLDIQIDSKANSITIGNCLLEGFELELFKNFINQ